MVKSAYIIKIEQKDITSLMDELVRKDCVFRMIRRDTIGKSSSNPTWGFLYFVQNGVLKYKGEGLYKEYDYDSPNASYSEKISSIMGKQLLKDARVPQIDVIAEKSKEPGIVSYKLLDNDAEDMFHIRDLMFYKYEREELEKKKDIFTIEDILECVRTQITDEKNYREVERSIIRTLLLDSITNNADRHNNNWALVRNKETNRYELAVFDHSASFIDMFEEQSRFTYKGWVGTYVKANEDNESKIRRGDMGNVIIEYIARNYKEYFEQFSNDFNEQLPAILEEIKNEQLPIDTMRLERKLRERKHFLNKVKEREDGIEYE